MLPTKFTIRDDFPPVRFDEWRSLAEADLHGASLEQKLVTHTYEGIDIQPVYTRRDAATLKNSFGIPGTPPFVRGSSLTRTALTGWDLRQEHSHPDVAVANRAILDDLEGGVTSILLRFDQAARRGLDPDNTTAAEFVAQDGTAAYNFNDLDAIFADVQLNLIGITLDAGAAFLPAAASLVALWRRRGTKANEARGAFDADPLSTLAADGQLPLPLHTCLSLLADLAQWTAANYPNVTAVGVDTAVYHNAGATAAQDVAFAIATALEYLRAMTAAGMDIDVAARQISFNFTLGTHHFLAIAKLRAARWLWSRVVEVCGGSPASGAMRMNARTSKRVLTQRDPYVNLLRNTASVFAAGIGGADSITSIPFDAQLGEPDEFSRRVARNTALVLQDEGHLHRVVDPAGGSWFLDNLTKQVAEKAWEVFQQVERQGGMTKALQSGWIANQIELAFAPRAKNIARRKEGITGVSEFPDVREQPLVHRLVDTDAVRDVAIRRLAATRQTRRSASSISAANNPTEAAIRAALDGASIGQIAHALGFQPRIVEIAPLEPHYFAAEFEELREASDIWYAAHGTRPAVFLVNMGPVSHHTARATYSKNFFEAGGFEVVSNNGFSDANAAVDAFVASGASIAVVCSSDKLYPELVPALAGKLKAAGARSVVLAGNPGSEQAWREAGVDRFIYIKCDVLATLREMLQEAGVLNAELETVQG